MEIYGYIYKITNLVNDASVDTGFSKQLLWALCSKRLPQYEGTEWEYVNDDKK